MVKIGMSILTIDHDLMCINICLEELDLSVEIFKETNSKILKALLAP